MHYGVPRGWIVLSVKAPQSFQQEIPEVPTTTERFFCSVRVLAAVTDCDQTREAMVNDIPSFRFPSPPCTFFL